MAFQAGYNKHTNFTPSGTAGTTPLNVTGWSSAEEVDKLDVTHTGTGGMQAVIAGILRVNGNVKANWDDAAVISSNPTPHIRAGTKGVIGHFMTGGQYITVPVMITKVNYQSAVEGKIEYNFDYTLDSLSGTYSLPS